MSKSENLTCPSCGYCKHCGRGGYQVYPQYPYPYIPYPYTPNPWPNPWITWTISSSHGSSGTVTDSVNLENVTIS
jgi:hypothetical protein